MSTTPESSLPEPQPGTPAADSASTAAAEAVTPAVPLAQRSPLQTLFLSAPDAAGHSELRSGWRFVAYVALVVVAGFVLTLVFQHVPHPKPWSELIGRWVMFLMALLPALLMGWLERRSLASYGLPLRRAFGRNFWVGAVWGMGSLSVLLGCIAAAGSFQVSGVALSGVHIFKWAAFWGAVFLGVGFAEEFLFRGYSLYTLTQGIGFWPSAAIFSALFGAVHISNGGESLYGAAAAGFIGFFFCLTVRRTGDLWWAVGFHMAWDWGESYFYGVADSGAVLPGHLLRTSFHGPDWLTGGTVGPEGSLLVFVLIAGLIVVFGRLYPQVRYPAEAVERPVVAAAAPVPVSPDNQL